VEKKSMNLMKEVGQAKLKIATGDVLAVLKQMPSNTCDGVFFDGPYGLTTIRRRLVKDSLLARGILGHTWDGGVASAEVCQELLRICKPGAWLLAFGHPRTWHRLATNIEDSGWQIRDNIAWIYGQGFPKSQDLGKKLNEKNWEGYGFALKPAHEPIILAMKPLEGSFAANAREWGVAGLNIAGCRIGNDEIAINRWDDGCKPFGNGAGHPYRQTRVQGRYPANIILDEEAAALLDEQTAGKVGNGHWPDTKTTGYGKFGGGECQYQGPGKKDRSKAGASRFFYCAKASASERNAGLDGFPLKRPDTRQGKALGIWDEKGVQPQQNHHPCVKPIALTTWLAQLILPPERLEPRRILIPYCGSGSEMIGALLAGWDEVLGIEQEKQYVEIAKARLQWWRKNRVNLDSPS
jgi:DNA modification methylase